MKKKLTILLVLILFILFRISDAVSNIPDESNRRITELNGTSNHTEWRYQKQILSPYADILIIVFSISMFINVLILAFCLYFLLFKLVKIDAEIVNCIGVCYYNRKEYRTAIKCFTYSINLKPRRGLFWENLALNKFNLEEYDKSELHYKHAMKCGREKAWLFNKIGIICSKRNETLKSLDYYLKAISIAEKNAKKYKSVKKRLKKLNSVYYFNAGTAYNNLKKNQEAIIMLRKAIIIDMAEYNENYKKIKKNGYAMEANNLIGVILCNNKKYEKSIIYYKEALKFNPEKYEKRTYFQNIGFANMELKRYKNAVKYYKKAIQDGYDRANTFSNCGHCLSKMKRFHECISYYDLAIEKSKPEKRDFYLHNKSHVLMDIDDNNGSLNCFLLQFKWNEKMYINNKGRFNCTKRTLLEIEKKLLNNFIYKEHPMRHQIFIKNHLESQPDSDDSDSNSDYDCDDNNEINIEMINIKDEKKFMKNEKYFCVIYKCANGIMDFKMNFLLLIVKHIGIFKKKITEHKLFFKITLSSNDYNIHTSLKLIQQYLYGYDISKSFINNIKEIYDVYILAYEMQIYELCNYICNELTNKKIYNANKKVSQEYIEIVFYIYKKKEHKKKSLLFLAIFEKLYIKTRNTWVKNKVINSINDYVNDHKDDNNNINEIKDMILSMLNEKNVHPYNKHIHYKEGIKVNHFFFNVMSKIYKDNETKNFSLKSNDNYYVKVHKEVLLLRSEYFKVLLESSFFEAKLNHIEVDVSKKLLNVIVKLIYEKKVNLNELEEELTQIEINELLTFLNKNLFFGLEQMIKIEILKKLMNEMESGVEVTIGKIKENQSEIIEINETEKVK